MKPLRVLITAVTLMCASCATTDPGRAFSALSYSVHAPGGAQQAVRSLDASGRVEGSHLSGDRGAPRVSMSSESARPEDVREVAALLPELPPESTTRELDARGYLQIQVIGGDGQVKTYRRAADSPFSHSVLQRLETIMRSYRAGYW